MTHRLHTPPDSRVLQNQPTSSGLDGDEIAAEVDEPPDESKQHTPRPSQTLNDGKFHRTDARGRTRNESLLTRILNEREARDEYDAPAGMPISRGMSRVSNWSNPSTASTAELTSDGNLTSSGSRTNTPSPPLPTLNVHALPGSTKQTRREHISFKDPHGARIVIPPNRVAIADDGEEKVAAGLGRRRCIKFGGVTDKPKVVEATVSPVASDPPSPILQPQPRKPSAIRFGPCPIREDRSSIDKRPTPPRRLSSPPPPSSRRASARSKEAERMHRGSNATLTSGSPQTTRKSACTAPPKKSNVFSEGGGSDDNVSEACRFHEFANSEEEVDDWTQEATCHLRRLTVNDTLKIENGLRKLVEEVEEEDDLDDEEDLDDDNDNDDDDDGDDNDDEDDDDSDDDDLDDDSDEGFRSDDEHGFASDDETVSEAGSDFAWWNPGRGATAERQHPVLDQRPRPRPNPTATLSASVSSGVSSRPVSPMSRPPRRTRKGISFRTSSPELPDSTDFVCGTLDEDRPLEERYLEHLREAHRNSTVDPTFPTSGPEMDESDDEDRQSVREESDAWVQGMEDVDGSPRKRSYPTGKTSRRSPPPPRRGRSPPPPRRTSIAGHRSPPPPKRPTAGHRSPPPPRKLFGQSPRRFRSPPPAGRLRSPPPTRRGSVNKIYQYSAEARAQRLSGTASVLGERKVAYASSVPRRLYYGPRAFPFAEAASRRVITPASDVHNPIDEDDEENDDPDSTPRRAVTPRRPAIDIVKGLEAKRARRREKLLQKWQNRPEKEKVKERERERKMCQGRGVERMRAVGLGCMGKKGAWFNGFNGLLQQPWEQEGDGFVMSV